MISLPFTLSSRDAWLKRSYTENLFETYAEKTTLKAFNIWYLDLLITDSLDAGGKVLGLPKRTWGSVFLVSGLAAALAWTLWRWRGDARGMIIWAALSMLLVVMLPTKVHERYLILSLPFIGLSCALAWRSWPGLILLTIAMMGQLSWPLWLSSGRGQWSEIAGGLPANYEYAVSRVPPAQRSQVPTLAQYTEVQRKQYIDARTSEGWLEWPFTLASLSGASLTVASLAATRRREQTARP